MGYWNVAKLISRLKELPPQAMVNIEVEIEDPKLHISQPLQDLGFDKKHTEVTLIGDEWAPASQAVAYD